MTSAERWLEAIWPVVRERLPLPPARVIDIGCGPHGGFVPFMRESGYDAVGVDTEAPDDAAYHQVRFEELEVSDRFDAAIASTSLHHVSDLSLVIDRIAASLRTDGAVIVVEWAWEDFDEGTARWCFQRLDEGEETWLHRRRDDWATSGQAWPRYLKDWVAREGIHPSGEIVRLLDERFERRSIARGPILFPDLTNTTAAEEQAAIDAREIRAMRIDWAGTLR